MHTGKKLSRILPTSTGLYTTLNLRPGPNSEPTRFDQIIFVELFGLWALAPMPRNPMSHQYISRQEFVAAAEISSNYGIYTQLGLATEDAIAMLVAWHFWSLDNTVNLADLIYRLNLRVSDEKRHYTPLEIADIKSKVSGSKKIVIDGRRYLLSITADVQPRELPTLFGVQWKQNPSVKLVPKVDVAAWQMLPKSISTYVDLLGDARSEMSSACYNKLKHGPNEARPQMRRVRRGCRRTPPVRSQGGRAPGRSSPKHSRRHRPSSTRSPLPRGSGFATSSAVTSASRARGR
jgi:hypothetical protein